VGVIVLIQRGDQRELIVLWSETRKRPCVQGWRGGVVVLGPKAKRASVAGGRWMARGPIDGGEVCPEGKKNKTDKYQGCGGNDEERLREWGEGWGCAEPEKNLLPGKVQVQRANTKN